MLKSMGQVVKYETMPVSEDEALSRIKEADIVVTASFGISERILKQCHSLKMICLACAGYECVDLEACNISGVVVSNIPSYATEAVAEHVFALLLSLMKKTREGDQRVRDGNLDRKGLGLSQLAGKVFGIIGTGRIGSHVARIANSFGCRVIATALHPGPERGKSLGVEYVDFETLLKESDVISIHVPLDRQTVDFIGHNEFRLMRKKPILINTARGKLINHGALVRALSEDMISGAGLDVLPYKSTDKETSLLRFSNVIFSPHNAFCTPEALENRAVTIIANIKSFIAGKPANIVSKNK